MSKSSKSAAAGASLSSEVPFEQALEKLEEIVESMEGEELPLETLLQRYEEGTKLAMVCQKKLAEAEIKIRQLEKTAAGEFVLKPFKADENSAESTNQ